VWGLSKNDTFKHWKLRLSKIFEILMMEKTHVLSCGFGYRVKSELSVFWSIILPLVGLDSALSESYRCFAASYCLLWVRIPRYRKVICVSEHHTASC